MVVQRCRIVQRHRAAAHAAAAARVTAAAAAQQADHEATESIKNYSEILFSIV